MEFTLDAYNMIFSDHNLAAELEFGNKILLPSTMLPDLNLEQGTVYFMLENKKKGVSVACGVHEYLDAPGICFIPHMMLDRLYLEDGFKVSVKQLTDIPKGEFIKIKPYEKKFIDLTDPKIVLERSIGKNYPILSVGEVIVINYLNEEFHIEIIECKPEATIQTTDCDISVEFDQPLDMDSSEENKSDERIPSPPPEQNIVIRADTKNPSRDDAVEDAAAAISYATETYDMRRSPGKGYRLGTS